jgi:hypothetical protein
MEFRLTYRGPLRSSQRDPERGQKDPRAEHKHDIRREFNSQLRRLWEITPFLKHGQASGRGSFVFDINNPPPMPYHVDALVARHAMYGFNFVPLVTHNLDLRCALDILFLRPDKPGQVLWAGDLDNRLKTLFDALTIPTANECYHERTPAADETPLFCLLEDDKLITKVSVETDQLLDWTGRDAGEAALVITGRLRPNDTSMHNVQFG